jgi:hypothetical protein
MSKPPNLIPSQQLNVALPLPVYVQLTAHLYSDLEQRVPHGAYSRFFTELLRDFFGQQQFDLAPFAASDPGAFIVNGSPEAISVLEHTLKGEINV